MYYNLPNDLIFNILNCIIHPYNSNYSISKSIGKKIKYILCENKKSIEKKLICSYCKKINNQKIFINGDGDYCISNKLPICQKHFLVCNRCNLKYNFYQYSFLGGCCMKCKYVK